MATLTLCSLLWSAPCYSLRGSIAAPTLATLSSLLYSLSSRCHRGFPCPPTARGHCGLPISPLCYGLAVRRPGGRSALLPSLLRRRGAIAATPVAIIVGRAPARRPHGGPSLGLALQGGPGPPIRGAGFAAGRSATELPQFIVVASLYVQPSPPSRPPSPPRSAAALYFTGPPQSPKGGCWAQAADAAPVLGIVVGGLAQAVAP